MNVKSSDIEFENDKSNSIIQKSIKSIASLGIRQILVQGANILGGIFLARLLTTKEFGLYSIVTFLMSFLITFGGTGLAANLIRQSEEPEKEDYKAIFTLQQIIVCFVAIIFWILSPTMSKIYNLEYNDAWIFRLVGISIFFTSFMVIPQVRLERKLLFDKLAIVEISQALSFNTIAILCAMMHLGAMSFAFALLIRSIVGAVLSNVVEPWKIGFKFDWNRSKKQLKFGLYYQGMQLISVIKDSITPILIGLSLGVIKVGYINWANMVSCYSLLILMVFQRVYMPIFAKVQMHPQKLVKYVEKTIWASNAIVAILAILTLVFIKPMIGLIFGQKWIDAIHIFYFLWLGNVFVPTSIVVGGLLNAIGHVKVNTIFSIINMIFTWVFGIIFIKIFGLLGFGIAVVIVQSVNLVFFRISQRYVKFKIIMNTIPVWIISGVVGLMLFIFENFCPVKNIYILFAYIFLGCILYIIFLYKIWPSYFKKLINLLKNSMKVKFN